jgi:23S rRNA pseudouridine1911/1915/1917 synthase
MSYQTFVVRRSEAGRTVAEFLRSRLRLSGFDARRLIREHWVRVGGVPCLDQTLRLHSGQRVTVRLPQIHKGKATQRRPKGRPRPATQAGRPKPQVPGLVIRFADAHVVVVEKPAGLTTMRHTYEAAEFGPRGRRFLPPTLADLLPDLLNANRPGRRVQVRAVHRLDRDTSGLVVFARTAQAAKHLGEQFRRHSVERRYLAIVRGRAANARIETFLVRDRGDGRRGSSRQPGRGERAVTHVQVVEDLGDFTLVECRLETGRTHQVRIHLGESGTPLCGERVYDRLLHGKPMNPEATPFARPALHAAALGFNHPATGKRMHWNSPLPPDMANLLEQLRARKKHRRPGNANGS